MSRMQRIHCKLNMCTGHPKTLQNVIPMGYPHYNSISLFSPEGMLTFIADSLDDYLKLREEHKKLQEEIQRLRSQSERSTE